MSRPSRKRSTAQEQNVCVLLFQTTARLRKERLVRTAFVSIRCAIATTVTAGVRVRCQVREHIRNTILNISNVTRLSRPAHPKQSFFYGRGILFFRRERVQVPAVRRVRSLYQLAGQFHVFVFPWIRRRRIPLSRYVTRRDRVVRARTVTAPYRSVSLNDSPHRSLRTAIMTYRDLWCGQTVDT